MSQEPEKKLRRILLGTLDLCGAFCGLTFAAGAILRLILGDGVSVVEVFVLAPFIVGGLGLSIIPKWKTPRIAFGSAFAVLLMALFVRALLHPGIE